jgi:hypothetical protein
MAAKVVSKQNICVYVIIPHIPAIVGAKVQQWCSRHGYVVRAFFISVQANTYIELWASANCCIIDEVVRFQPIDLLVSAIRSAIRSDQQPRWPKIWRKKRI